MKENNYDIELYNLFFYISEIVDANLDERVQYYIEDKLTEEEFENEMNQLRERMLKQETLRIMANYLKQNIHIFSKKRRLILYIFYEIYNYHQEFDDESLPIKKEYVNALYDLKNNEKIFNEIIDERILILLIKSYFNVINILNTSYEESDDIYNLDEIEFTEETTNELSKKSENDIEKHETFIEENQTLFLPNLYKLVLTDLDGIFLEAQIDENTKLSMLSYNIFDEISNDIPSPLSLSFEEIFSNNKVFLEDLYLNSLIYFECKDKAIGLTPDEQIILKRLKNPRTEENPIETFTENDKMLILKAYIHMCYNQEQIDNNYKNIVDNCIKLTRKRINPICAIAYKY